LATDATEFCEFSIFRVTNSTALLTLYVFIDTGSDGRCHSGYALVWIYAWIVPVDVARGGNYTHGILWITILNSFNFSNSNEMDFGDGFLNDV
jgi:hypothetical protein